MAHLNAWSGTVNLATEPELRQITENFKVCRLRACSTVRRKVDGAWSDKPVWLTIEVYGHDANYVARYAHKGSFMAVQGELEYHEWTGQDAQKKSELRVAVDARNGGAVNLAPKQASNGQTTPQTQVQQAPCTHRRRSRRRASNHRPRPRRSRTGTSRRPWRRRRPRFRKPRPWPWPRRRVLPRSRRPHRARNVRCPRQPLAARAVPVPATAVPAGQDDIPF